MQSIRSLRDDMLATGHFAGADVALIEASEGDEYTFETTLDLAGGVAGYLDELGVPQDGIVLSLLPNTAWHCIYFLGVVASGRGYAPVAPESPIRELRDCVDCLSPTIILASRFVPSGLQAAMAERHIPVVFVDTGNPFSDVTRPGPGKGLRKATGHGALFVRTSGTTGAPRFLKHDIDTLWTAGSSFAHWHNLESKPKQARFLNLYPFDYLAATFNTCMIPWAVGGAVIYDRDYRSTGRSSQIWNDINRHKVTHLWLTPLMLRDLNGDLDTPLSGYARDAAKSLECVFVGMGAVTNVEKATFEQGYGVPVLENYALSETTFLTTETAATRRRGGPGNCGKILPWVDLKASEGSPSEIMGDGVGELAAKTPFLARGTLSKNGDLEPLPLDPEGYFRTADSGRVTPDRDVTLKGRLRDIIKRDDGLIQLHEIEARAEEHELVSRAAAVIQRQDGEGDTFVLFINGAELSQEKAPEVEAWLHNQIPRRMWPASVRCVDRMPVTATGKIKKHELAMQISSEGHAKPSARG